MITQIFNPNAGFAIPSEKTTNEGNVEIETQPLAAETKARKCSK